MLFLNLNLFIVKFINIIKRVKFSISFLMQNFLLIIEKIRSLFRVETVQIIYFLKILTKISTLKI